MDQRDDDQRLVFEPADTDSPTNERRLFFFFFCKLSKLVYATFDIRCHVFTYIKREMNIYYAVKVSNAELSSSSSIRQSRILFAICSKITQKRPVLPRYFLLATSGNKRHIGLHFSLYANISIQFQINFRS